MNARLSNPKGYIHTELPELKTWYVRLIFHLNSPYQLSDEWVSQM